MKTIGERIRELRKERGLTQTELANLAGMSLQTVNVVENGVNNPSSATASKLATALKVTIDDLYGTFTFGTIHPYETSVTRNIRKLVNEKITVENEINREAEQINWLADHTMIPSDIIKKIITGEFLPSAESINRISNSLEVSKDALLKPDTLERSFEEVEFLKFVEKRKQRLDYMDHFLENLEPIEFEDGKYVSEYEQVEKLILDFIKEDNQGNGARLIEMYKHLLKMINEEQFEKYRR